MYIMVRIIEIVGWKNFVYDDEINRCPNYYFVTFLAGSCASIRFCIFISKELKFLVYDDEIMLLLLFAAFVDVSPEESNQKSPFEAFEDVKDTSTAEAQFSSEVRHLESGKVS